MAVQLLFASVIVLVYFSGLSMPLVGPDEPRYSQVAREMFERGDWVTPTLGGYTWFEKPILLYWIQIASFNLFGISEFTVRLGSAFFGLGTILSLWILGRRLELDSAQEAEQSPTSNFANLLALVAASTVGIIAFAHGASFDIIVTFPITAAIVAFFIYDSARSTSALTAFYVFIGLALLAKGLIGIVFPFAIIGFYHLLSWKLPDRRLLISGFWGLGISILVASTWYLPVYLRHGHDFIDHFFIQHHFQRYTSNKFLHPQPFHFFFWVLPLMTIPWMPFFLAALWDFARNLVVRRTNDRGVSHRLRLLALAWVAVPLVFFSFSGSKLPGYILPAVPAAVILAADFIYRFMQKSSLRRYGIQAAAATTFLICTFAAFAVAPHFAEADSVKHLFEAAADRGLSNAPVLMLHGVSHNAEFYAPGRIVRGADGKQKRFPGPSEVSQELHALGAQEALVIVPLPYLGESMNNRYFDSEILDQNGEVALLAIQLR